MKKIRWSTGREHKNVGPAPILFFALLCCCIPTLLFSQSLVQGQVKDASQHPLGGCNVLLLKAKDSVLVRGTLTDRNGQFEISAAAAGNYLLAFSFAGYGKKYMPVTLSASQKEQMGGIILQPVTDNLKQVTVTAYKAMFEQMPDRMVVNVKNSITNAGGTVLDVLEKSPGILVNRQNGVINMSGKDGVQVMINGKLTYLPADALIAMLEGMNATQVEKIELISIPPSKFDAVGNAGYINIVLQQSPDEGFTANISLTMAAFYGTAPSASFDFNYRKKRSNFYGGYGFSRRTQHLDRYSYRQINLYNQILETATNAVLDVVRPNHNLRLGYDYEWSKKTTLGLLLSGYHNSYNENATQHSVFSTNSAIDTTVSISSTEKNPWKNGMANVYIQHTPDKISQLSFNMDLLFYKNSDRATYHNDYLNSAGNFVYGEDVASAQQADFTIFPLQLDYRRKLHEKITMETGIKTVFSSFTNNVLVSSLTPSGWEANPDHTATYKLKENIKAAYLSSTFLINKKNTLQAGLRYEYTDANLGTRLEKDIVDRHYGKLFPSILWNHKISNGRSFNLAYSRRINRPAFNQLAPFLFFADPSSVITGNPALQPSISDAVSVDVLIRQMAFSLGYTNEGNYINGFLPLVDTVTKTQVSVPRNITYLKTLNARVTIPFTIAPWWSSIITVNGSWQKAHAEDYIQVTKERTATRFSVSGIETFRFAKSYSFEMSGLYVSRGLLPNGIGIREPYGNLNVAAQKKFRDKATAIIIGVDNIFSSMNIRGFTDVPEANFTTRVNLPSPQRIFKISFTHRFGNKAMKDKKARSTASEEERKRIN